MLALRHLRVVAPALVSLALVSLICLGLAALFGATIALVVICLFLLVLYLVQLYFLAALGSWLSQPSLNDIPEGFGTWAEVFGRLYRWQRTSEVQQKRLSDNEERFRRTVSALPDGLLLVDAGLHIEWCNPVAERHLNLALTADQGLRLTNLVRDPSLVNYLVSGQFDEPLMFRPMAKPGLILSLVVISFEPSRSIVVTRDVTLSERLDAMRRDFVANVSHELRTPLTVIKGFLEAFVDSSEDLNPTRRHHLLLMSEQADRMHHLIEDLLTLSRLESENPSQDDVVDVNQLIHEVADEARTLSAERHHIYISATPAWVRGCRDELRSAFGNLVSNAVRYTPKGGVIHLTWIQEHDGCSFQVRDSGIGIAPEHIPRLTERFYRVDKSRSRETGGTGLGLAIVKHIMIRHQGRLDITSEPGVGSTFSAWLPRSRMAMPDQGNLVATVSASEATHGGVAS